MLCHAAREQPFQNARCRTARGDEANEEKEIKNKDIEQAQVDPLDKSRVESRLTTGIRYAWLGLVRSMPPMMVLRMAMP